MALACAGAPVSGAEAERAPARNIILIVVDALRPDHLGAYGYPRATSPNMDALAQEGTLFKTVVAQSNWTLPALASLMTSQYPSRHGAVRPPGADIGWVKQLEGGGYRPSRDGRLDASRLTLAGYLRGRGYHTAGIVSGGVCRSEFGFGNGFDEFVNQGSRLEVLNRWILPWLEKNRGRRFFLYIHAGDVHSPYDAGERYNRLWDPDYSGPVDGRRETLQRIDSGDLKIGPRDVRHLKALYDGCVSYSDEHIGKILEAFKRLGLWDRSIVVLTADHGEELLEHGLLEHGQSGFDTVLRVPLLMRFPGGKSGVRIEDVVQAIDLFPTLMDLAGLPRPEGLAGSSVYPLLLGESMPPRPAYSEIGDLDLPGLVGCAVRTARWKYIKRRERSAGELYDLALDPGELRDVSGANPETAAELGRVSAGSAGR